MRVLSTPHSTQDDPQGTELSQGTQDRTAPRPLSCPAPNDNCVEVEKLCSPHRTSQDVQRCFKSICLARLSPWHDWGTSFFFQTSSVTSSLEPLGPSPPSRPPVNRTACCLGCRDFSWTTCDNGTCSSVQSCAPSLGRLRPRQGPRCSRLNLWPPQPSAEGTEPARVERVGGDLAAWTSRAL